MRLSALYVTVCLAFLACVFCFCFALAGQRWVMVLIMAAGAVFCWNWLNDPKKWH